MLFIRQRQVHHLMHLFFVFIRYLQKDTENTTTLLFFSQKNCYNIMISEIIREMTIDKKL